VDDKFALDRALIDADLHQALVVADGVLALEVLEHALAPVRTHLDPPRVLVVLHVGLEVGPHCPDPHRQKGDWQEREV
jgi:hypothetical protein